LSLVLVALILRSAFRVPRSALHGGGRCRGFLLRCGQAEAVRPGAAVGL